MSTMGTKSPSHLRGEVLSRQISVTRNVCLPKRRDSKNWINRMENVPDVGKKRPLTRRMDITRRGMPMAAKPRTRITLKCVKIVTRIYTLLNPNEKRSRTKTSTRPDSGEYRSKRTSCLLGVGRTNTTFCVHDWSYRINRRRACFGRSCFLLQRRSDTDRQRYRRTIENTTRSGSL